MRHRHLVVPRPLPEVLTREEVKRVLDAAAPELQMPLRLLYGTGLRLMELLRLRIKDVDFTRNQIVVRGGKGQKDRVTMLPESLKAELAAQVERWRLEHAREVAAGRGATSLPEGVVKKYPGAAREWPWQYLFPAAGLTSVDGAVLRHHLHEDGLQRGMKAAVARAILTTTPQGQAADAALVKWLMSHQQEAGVFTTIATLVTEVSDNPAAREAAREILARTQRAG